MIDAGMDGEIQMEMQAKESAKNGRLYWLTADQGPLRKAVQHPEDVEHIGGFRAEPGPGGIPILSPQIHPPFSIVLIYNSHPDCSMFDLRKRTIFYLTPRHTLGYILGAPLSRDVNA